MILYTPMQLELVFAGMEGQQVSRQREVVINNTIVVVEENKPGSGRVVRLLSTNPHDYLRPEFAPGTEITF